MSRKSELRNFVFCFGIGFFLLLCPACFCLRNCKQHSKNQERLVFVCQILEEHGPAPATVRNWPVVAQFSSIGSLGTSEGQWLCGELYTSLSAANGSGTALGGNSKNFKLVSVFFPFYKSRVYSFGTFHIRSHSCNFSVCCVFALRAEKRKNFGFHRIINV